MDTEQNLLLELERLRERGRLSDAMLIARELVRRDAHSARARRALGELLLQKGQPAEALTSLALAIELDPDDASARNHQGRALNNLRRPQEAVQAFEQALSLDPGYADAWHNLGHVRRVQGDLQAAQRALLKALALDPELVPARHKLGLVYLAQGEHALAERELALAHSAAPTRLPVITAHGISLHHLGRYEEALAVYQQALDLDRNHLDAHANMAITLHELNRFEQAVQHYQVAVELAPNDPSLPPKLCDALLAASQPQAALTAAEHTLARMPGLAGAIAARVVALTHLGRDDEVSGWLDYKRLIFRERIERMAGYESLQSFNQSLASFVSSHPTLRYERAGNATRKGGHTGNLLSGYKGPVAALERYVQLALERVRQTLRESDARYGDTTPSRWRLNMWAVVMNRHGHQLPHIHPTAWFSGVYYAALPDSVGTGVNRSDTIDVPAQTLLLEAAQPLDLPEPKHAGWIEFGRPPDDILGPQLPATRLICPSAGDLLLFPSYFFHRTIPFDDTQPRISIAFDAIPVER